MCMAPRPPERLGGGPTLHTAGLPRLPGPAHHLAGGGRGVFAATCLGLGLGGWARCGHKVVPFNMC